MFVQGWLPWGLRVRLRGLGDVFVSLLTTLLYQRKAADPSRFTNRGGNLLKEEKQRAKLQKTLSKVGPALGKNLWSPCQRKRDPWVWGHRCSGQSLHCPSCPDQLQEELERKIQAWEQEFEGTFLVKGRQFMEYVSEQWQVYHLEKEKEKKERVSTELSMLASAGDCSWLLPKNASLGLSRLGKSRQRAGAHRCHIHLCQAPFWPWLCQR